MRIELAVLFKRQFRYQQSTTALVYCFLLLLDSFWNLVLPYFFLPIQAANALEPTFLAKEENLLPEPNFGLRGIHTS